MWNLFVKDFNGKSWCVQVDPEDTVHTLKSLVATRTGICASQQLLYPCRGPSLRNHATLADEALYADANLQLSARLRGGKGGFGSLLRGAAKTTATDNEDACRDLSGRRLRVVNAEKKLVEWQAGEKSRKAAIQAAKEEKERQKAEKRAEITQEQLDDIRSEQSAVTQNLAKAIRTAQSAGQKRSADESQKAPKAKKFRGDSDEDDSESDSDDEDDSPSTHDPVSVSEVEDIEDTARKEEAAGEENPALAKPLINQQSGGETNISTVSLREIDVS